MSEQREHARELAEHANSQSLITVIPLTASTPLAAPPDPGGVTTDGHRASTSQAERRDTAGPATAEPKIGPAGGGWRGTGPGGPDNGELPAWRDPARPVAERVSDLLSRMSLEEKIAQLYGVWLGAEGAVAPHQDAFAGDVFDWGRLIAAGLGQLTRPFGTAPVEPAGGARALARRQAEIVAAGRFGIPAIAHEECLAGFTTWGATIYPVPLAWGATFDPELVEQMAGQIGTAMRRLGVHQGLAPVLDVTRDPRWGRTEETIGEDPYLVGTIATAYVRGLQSAGIVATLKHFAGYSGSLAGRNFAPVAVGRRELADLFLLPFEMAVRLGGARSVMAAYTEIDGVPATADGELLTGLLRDSWGFSGTVVADYFGVSFLQMQHRVAGTDAQAAGLALAAGVDVELPSVRCYGTPLLAAVRGGKVPESLIVRAARRVLWQKCELGMLDPGWSPVPTALTMIESPNGTSGSVSPEGRDGRGGLDGRIDLDPPPARALARRLAEESVVLLANRSALPLRDGTLPLRDGTRLAVVGPVADDPASMLGAYSFPRHMSGQYPDLPMGVDIPTLLDALRDELPLARLDHVTGCTVDGDDTAGIPPAVAAAANAEVCLAVLGDRAGLFGQGTSGEGSDAADLCLPGVQGKLLDALLATGTPVVLVLLSGRPYALGRYADRLAAVVQAFFAGEEGGPAVAGVLSGRVCPSGRLPVSVPRTASGPPVSYLTPLLGRLNDASVIDPTPLYPFGHGLSYTDFEWTDPAVSGRMAAGSRAELDGHRAELDGHRAELDGHRAELDGHRAGATGEPVETGTDGELTVSVTVRNTGSRAGAEVVQLYLHDPVAQVTRPVTRLIGYARLALEPDQAARVSFAVHADLTSFTGRAGRRVVEPGDLELSLAVSSVDIRQVFRVRLVGEERVVDHRRQLTAGVTVTPLAAA